MQKSNKNIFYDFDIFDLKCFKQNQDCSLIASGGIEKSQEFLKNSAPKLFGNFPVRHPWWNPF